jgi:GNAT superfamily N-acetyltransferase
MRIRKAKLNESKEISKLRRETLKKINICDYTSNQLAILIKTNSFKEIENKIHDRDMFCLIDNGEIKGVVDLRDNQIGGLFVRKDLIGKGYGKNLLVFIENYAKKLRYKNTILYSSKSAQSFYEKYGYAVVERGFGFIKGVKFSKIKMEKKLK